MKKDEIKEIEKIFSFELGYYSYIKVNLLDFLKKNPKNVLDFINKFESFESENKDKNKIIANLILMNLESLAMKIFSLEDYCYKFKKEDSIKHIIDSFNDRFNKIKKLKFLIKKLKTL